MFTKTGMLAGDRCYSLSRSAGLVAPCWTHLSSTLTPLLLPGFSKLQGGYPAVNVPPDTCRGQLGQVFPVHGSLSMSSSPVQLSSILSSSSLSASTPSVLLFTVIFHSSPTSSPITILVSRLSLLTSFLSSSVSFPSSSLSSSSF